MSGRDFTYDGEKVKNQTFHVISCLLIDIALLIDSVENLMLNNKGLPVWDKHSLDQLWLRLRKQRLVGPWGPVGCRIRQGGSQDLRIRETQRSCQVLVIVDVCQVAEAGGNSVRVWVHVEGDSRLGVF